MVETALMVAGGVVGSLAGKLLEDKAAATVRGAADAMRDRMSARLPLPENHDLVRGLRRAHLIALDRVTKRYEKARDTLPPHEFPEADRIFAESMRGFLDGRIKLLSDRSLEVERVDEAAIRHALDNLVLPAPSDDQTAIQAQAAGRAAAEAAALAEIKASVGSPTSLFLSGFRGELGVSSANGGSWHDMMALHVTEMIKTQERFRSIFVASELVDIKRLINSSERAIAELITAGVEDIRDDIAALRAEGREQHGAILDAVDSIPEKTVQALLKQTGSDIPKRLEEYGILKGALIELARRISLEVQGPEEALAELRTAFDLLIKAQETLLHGSNLDPSVDAILKHIAELSGAGRFDEASAEADRAIAQWEEDEAERAETAKQQGLKLLDAGLQQDLLRRDPDAAAQKILKRLKLEHPSDPSALIDALRSIFKNHLISGRDFGGLLSLEVSVALAELTAKHAPNEQARGIALNDLGASLLTLGPRQVGLEGQATMEIAIKTLSRALKLNKRSTMPLAWANIQNNLGIALQEIGIRKRGDKAIEYLERSVISYQNALKVRLKKVVPHDWANTQNNLGNALQEIGSRLSDADVTRYLERSIQAFEHALEVQTMETKPVDWAKTQNNLGNTLQEIGTRKTGVEAIEYLERSVQAYEYALKVRKPDAMPVDWADTLTNVGQALIKLGIHMNESAPIRRGISAIDKAMEIFSASRSQKLVDEVIATRQIGVNWLDERG